MPRKPPFPAAVFALALIFDVLIFISKKPSVSHSPLYIIGQYVLFLLLVLLGWRDYGRRAGFLNGSVGGIVTMVLLGLPAMFFYAVGFGLSAAYWSRKGGRPRAPAPAPVGVGAPGAPAQAQPVVHAGPPIATGRIDERALGVCLQELDNQVGLDRVKEEVHSLVQEARTNVQARRHGLQVTNTTRHLVFVGPPGTGKTSVARIVARVYHALGLLGSDKVIEAARDDFVGDVLGQTAMKTNALIDKALGGVLFIDEAYSLSIDAGIQGGDNFGREAVTTLLRRMENDRDRLVVIIAGYEDEIHDFLKTNPGLARRFPNTLHFETYTPAQLVQITSLMARQRGKEITPDGLELLTTSLEHVSPKRIDEAGNAGWARNIVDAASRKQANRIGANKKFSKVDYAQLTAADLDGSDPAVTSHSQDAGASVEEIVEAINSQVGLSRVKDEVKMLVAHVQMNTWRARQGRSVQPLTNHLVFAGPPGTGKTTIARKIAELYYALGLLPDKKVSEVSRSDLVGQHLGETAIKTNNAVDRALGGVLFIDEVYSLTNTGGGQTDKFGMEAVDTLIARMENDRDRLVVIVAGYEREVERWLDSNAGLRSRFPRTLRFDTYTAVELTEIADKFASQTGDRLSDDAKALLEKAIEPLTPEQINLKGNARWMRNAVGVGRQNRDHRLIVTYGSPDNIPDLDTASLLEFQDLALS